MVLLKRILAGVSAAAGTLLYLWFAGVRSAPRAKRRRALSAARRRA